jgi:hypothetical protein
VAHVDIDFTIPIALLGASMVGVMLVRLAAVRGEQAGRERTRRLIEQVERSARKADRSSRIRHEDGMSTGGQG